MRAARTEFVCYLRSVRSSAPRSRRYPRADRRPALRGLRTAEEEAARVRGRNAGTSFQQRDMRVCSPAAKDVRKIKWGER